MKTLLFGLMIAFTTSLTFANDYDKFEGLYKLKDGTINCQAYLKIHSDTSYFYISSSNHNDDQFYRNVLVLNKLEDIDNIINGESLKFNGKLYSDDFYSLLPIAVPYNIKVTAYLLDNMGLYIKTKKHSMLGVGAKDRECTYTQIIQ